MRADYHSFPAGDLQLLTVLERPMKDLLFLGAITLAVLAGTLTAIGIPLILSQQWLTVAAHSADASGSFGHQK